MAFAAVLGFIFLLGLFGEKPGRRAYLLIAVAALVAAAWEYLS
jgi:hypothetical protein